MWNNPKKQSPTLSAFCSRPWVVPDAGRSAGMIEVGAIYLYSQSLNRRYGMISVAVAKLSWWMAIQVCE
jgi:hypothetical protein